MSTSLKLPTELRRSRGLSLVLTAEKERRGATQLIAAQILHGPLFVVSGSEWLPAYELARIVRGKTLQVRQALNRLTTVRASTCYRLLDSLAGIPSSGEPVLVLDFLHTFYDDDIPLRVRFFKLRECCRELKRLAFYRPVVLMMQEAPGEDFEQFMGILRPVVDRTLFLEPEMERAQQLALF
jgi:hypothetical protein